jgi:NADH-quinone oxidoreductase subunit J
VEIAAVILLVAMIAAIALTLREAQGQQGHRCVAGGARAPARPRALVKMASTQAPSAPAAPAAPAEEVKK